MGVMTAAAREPTGNVQSRYVPGARLRQLAAAAAERGTHPLPTRRAENQREAYFEIYSHLPLRERQARSLAYALTREEVRLFHGERLHGLIYGHGPDPQWDSAAWGSDAACPSAAARAALELPDLGALTNQWPESAPQPGVASFIISGGAIPGHVGWDYDWVLREGILGVMARHREAMETTDDPERQAYFEAVLICWEAVLEWNRRHVTELRRLRLSARDAAERERLDEAIALMERVPAHPARTFHEALQSFWFLWTAIMYEAPYGGNSPGRLDWFLWPHLQKEWQAGTLTYHDAADLVAELFIKIDERVHPWDGHVNTIVVGGVGPDGVDAVNPLSTMFLDVFEQLDLTHPAVYTRLSSKNPPDYRERCIDFLLNGGNRAQLLADDNIIPAMTRDGRMPFADAAMYMCGGCMELSPHGMNSDLLFSFLYNVPKTLELVLTGGECLTTGQRQRLSLSTSLRDCATFDEFYDAFRTEMTRTLRQQFRCLDIYSEEMARCRPLFLQSALISDCLATGRSQQDGGARYSDYGGTPLGIQNAADSLHAIRTVVFEERSCTADELIDALRADFVGHEALRLRLLAVPKYGNGNPEADAMAARVLSDVCAVFDGYTNRHGGRVKPIVFTFVWAPQMGHSLGASPDGRRAGRPIGHGLTPQAVGMKEGITTAIRSCTGLPAVRVSGGASTMWDMDAAWIDHPRLLAIVNTFIDRGGQIFQGNTTDVARLEAALLAPEEHADVIVRVGGYSARFVSLDRSLQTEIIERHRHRR